MSWFLIDLDWIRGHDNSTGNETADMLAKKGAETENNLITPDILCDYNQATAKLKRRMLDEWNKSWRDRKRLMSHDFIQAVDRAAAMVFRRFPKELQRMTIQLITGHSVLNGHMHRIGLADEPICRLCLEEDETPLHILHDCPAVERDRRNTLLPFLDRQNYSTLKNLLLGMRAFLTTKSVKELFEVVG